MPTVPEISVIRRGDPDFEARTTSSADGRPASAIPLSKILERHGGLRFVLKGAGDDGADVAVDLTNLAGESPGDTFVEISFRITSGRQGRFGSRAPQK